MTVKEIIIELLKYPMDAEIMIPASESPYYNATNIVRDDAYINNSVIIE